MAAIDYGANPIIGLKGRKQTLPKKELFVDHLYQRDRSLNSTLRSYAQNFSWPLFGEIIVADYGSAKTHGNRFAIVDGQGRWMVSTLRQDITSVPCLIYDLTPEMAAEVYYYLNTARKTPTSAEKYKAALIFKDPPAIEINRILSSKGISVTKSNHPKSLDSISACFRCIKMSTSGFESTIDILSELCQNHRITQYLLKGTFYMVRNIDGIETNGTLERLKKRMCYIGAEKLNTAQNAASARLFRGDRLLAECLLEVINYKLQEGSRFYLKLPRYQK
ncbi:MAG TPA: hypothetical protein VMY59_03925 [Candidatus Thermoplasmatota archaeon]|nr:hypothetical protein [Candidatus Thermoplasmatota archaeon]